MSSDIALNYQRYRDNPYAFLTECVFTLDQVDQKDPIKLFPDKEYLELYVSIWMRCKLLAVPKSRRMTMSWTNIALFLWDAIFHKGRFMAFVSKKEEHAGELVERAEYIFKRIPHDKIPPDMLPRIKNNQMTKKPPVLEFPDINSKIQGFPMGADQLRQFTFSGILGDEAAFWPEARQFYSASKPTLDGGGRMSLISSAAPGFFKKIVFDTLNNEMDLDTVPEGAIIQHPMQGVRMWKNPDNQFWVIEIHYTADEDKRHPEFKEMLIKTLPRRQYLQEYEIDWDTFEGMAVYEDFTDAHISHEEIEPRLGLPLVLGWDFGLTPSAVVCQLVDDQLFVLREFVAKNKPIDTFAPEVMNHLRIAYPEWHDSELHFRHWIDPAGTFRSEVDANTCMKEMHAQGIRKIFPGDVTWEARKGAVNHWLKKLSKHGPGLIVNERLCPVLIKGFRGGYHYPEKAQEIEPTKIRPLKNEFSHPHDALQYVCGGVRKLMGRSGSKVNIRPPGYGFQKEDVPGKRKGLIYG